MSDLPASRRDFSLLVHVTAASGNAVAGSSHACVQNDHLRTLLQEKRCRWSGFYARAARPSTWPGNFKQDFKKLPMFSELLQKERVSRYRSARSFCGKADLSFSYTHYKNIEDGTAVPSPEHVVEIAKALGLNLRQCLFAWAHDMMPDEESRLVFSVTASGERFVFQEAPGSDSFEINRHQAAYIGQNPVAWEILLYLLCEYSHVPGHAKTTVEIAEQFRMEESVIRNIVRELYRLGLLNLDDNGRGYSTREWVYFKREPEVEDVRAKLLGEAFAKFEHARAKGLPAHHLTLTQHLTDELAAELISRLRTVINWLSEQAKGPLPKGRPYTLGLFLSPRLYGSRES
jgi:predicted transcriptional regulator